MTEESSARRSRRTDARAARRTATLEAALDEFCERGFAATRVEAEGSMWTTVEAILRALMEQIQTTRVGDLFRLMIAENARFPALAQFYYREVVQRAMNAIERL